ncbi:MAG: helix-turn-helix domain-containing protein [Ruminococcaceae bacterium]|nr:helix-turn-helix domain-containing protein [Oscillospiraceae bacterium]
MATVEKRGNSYRITVSAGYDITGKQIKKRYTWTPEYGMTERQIKKELERQKVKFEERVQSGQIMDSSIRFADFAEYWLAEYAEKQLRPRTVARYKDMLTLINRIIGNIRLERLQPKHLIELYNDIEKNGSRRGATLKAKVDIANLLKKRKMSRAALAKKAGVGARTVSAVTLGETITEKSALSIAKALEMPLKTLFEPIGEPKALSGKTILHHHRLVSSILEKAVKWQVIFSNPCSRVEPPKAERKEAEYLDEIQAQELLNCLQAEPLQYRAMITVLLYSGMRRGELCGLEWSDIDFNNNLIDISRSSLYLNGRGVFDDETKTQSSKRVIKVPDEVIEVLRQHQKEQITTRLKLGDKWINSNKIFTQWNGKAIHPCTVSAWFSDFIKKNNLPPIHLHSLRHTNATLLIASGVDLRTVSKRLGHSNMTTTSNVYAHAIKSADERAAELLGNILKPLAQKRA